MGICMSCLQFVWRTDGCRIQVKSLGGTYVRYVKPIHESATIFRWCGDIQKMTLRDVLRDFPPRSKRFVAASNHQRDRNVLNSLALDCAGNAQVVLAQAKKPKTVGPRHHVGQLPECGIEPFELQWKVINLAQVFRLTVLNHATFNRAE